MGADIDIAKQDLPMLLAGSKPSNAAFEGLGSGDYSKRPEAVKPNHMTLHSLPTY
jgi:hypothetical protein